MRRPSVLIALVLTTACASGNRGGPTPQPVAFPGAPAPPAPVTPTTVPPDSNGTTTSSRSSNAAPSPRAAMAEAVVDTALDYRGIHYVLGGDDPSVGFDCSGLVEFVFGRHQVTLPRTAAEQFRVGVPVPLADLGAGDLVFFSTIGPGPTHVGIAIDRDQFVHAPNETGVVRVEHIDTSYWHNRFIGARRVF
jgi:cell wall-associated NlpC family hydrolase